MGTDANVVVWEGRVPQCRPPRPRPRREYAMRMRHLRLSCQVCQLVERALSMRHNEAMVVRFEEVHTDGVCILPNVNFKVLSRVIFGTPECVWPEKETRPVENEKGK